TCENAAARRPQIPRHAANPSPTGLPSRVGCEGPSLRVNLANCLEGHCRLGSPTEFHAGPFAGSGGVDGPAHGGIVDFTGRRLVASGMVGKLKVADQVVVLADIAA